MLLVSITSDECVASLQGRSSPALLCASQEPEFRRQSPEKSWVSLPHGSGRCQLVMLRPQHSTGTKITCSKAQGAPRLPGRHSGGHRLALPKSYTLPRAG